jgi:hypothetical protein
MSHFEVTMEEVSFTDSSGVSWTVREDGADDSRSAHSDAQPGTSWLRFDSELEVRRLWHYPDDWRGLNPLQLETLLDRASTVIARFRSVPRPNRAADLNPQPASPPSLEMEMRTARTSANQADPSSPPNQRLESDDA